MSSAMKGVKRYGNSHGEVFFSYRGTQIKRIGVYWGRFGTEFVYRVGDRNCLSLTAAKDYIDETIKKNCKGGK